MAIAFNAPTPSPARSARSARSRASWYRLHAAGACRWGAFDARMARAPQCAASPSRASAALVSGSAGPGGASSRGRAKSSRSFPRSIGVWTAPSRLRSAHRETLASTYRWRPWTVTTPQRAAVPESPSATERAKIERWSTSEIQLTWPGAHEVRTARLPSRRSSGANWARNPLPKTPSSRSLPSVEASRISSLGGPFASCSIPRSSAAETRAAFDPKGPSGVARKARVPSESAGKETPTAAR